MKHDVNPHVDRQKFRQTAYRTNSLNFKRTNMRGGIRL